MHSLRLFALLVTSTALFGAVGIDTFHWSGHVPPGQLIEVRGINGSIHAEPAVGREVDVLAYRNGHQVDPGDIKVRVLEHDGGVTICAIYPSHNNDVSIDFTVRVPKGVRFLARTVNGLVEANALDAYTEAHTVNGNLRLSTAGTAQGETVNGSIIASVGRITEALKFSTVNGGITLEMPRGTGAEVHANTVHGNIATDFRIAARGRLPGKHVDGLIGHGGPQLHLATVNGSINLRKRS
jgi:hypothetical protein